MIIYAAADIHGKPNRIALVKHHVRSINPDVLVLAGDITHYTNAAAIITRLNSLSVPVLAVRGNSDLPGVEKLINTSQNTHSLHLQTISVKGAIFTGIGGTIPFPFYSKICIREKRALKKLEPLIRDHSILVSHTPPRWARDEVMGKFFAGSKYFHTFIKNAQPDILICGHIHERAGTALIGKTLVVNCSISKNSAGAVIEYKKGDPPRVEMIQRSDIKDRI